MGNNNNNSTGWQLFHCAIGLHSLKIIKEEEVKNIAGTVIGKQIVSQCTVCGKLKVKYIHLSDRV